MTNHPEAALRAQHSELYVSLLNARNAYAESADKFPNPKDKAILRKQCDLITEHMRQIEAAPSPPDSSQGGPIQNLCGWEFDDAAGVHHVTNSLELPSYAQSNIKPRYTHPSSPQVAAADGLTREQIVQQIMQDACEQEPAPWDGEGTICIDVDALQMIVEAALFAPAAPPSAPKPADDEPLFTASMYGTAERAAKAREEWLATNGEPQARHWFDPARMPSERDGDGYISHPDSDLRIWFNGVPEDEAPLDPERFAELGLEVKFCTEEIEYADDDNHMENPLNPPEKWDGNRPPGEGWRLGGTYPTEAGHAAFWVRSLAQADKDKTQ